MRSPRDGDFSPAELAKLDALVSAASALRMKMRALQAREAQLIHEAARLAGDAHARTSPSRFDAEMPYRTVAAEFGAAFRISDRSVQRMMSEADILITMFPATFASLAAGHIDRAHARVLTEAGAHIDDPSARADFETTALVVAERESASRLRPFAKLLAERLHPRSLTERHEAAATERAVRVIDLPDGMAELVATLPSTMAHAVFDRLSAMARSVLRAAAAEARENQDRENRAREDQADDAPPRTTDQLRVDILTDLLLAGIPEAHGPAGLGAIRATVQVVVPVLSLLGATQEPATLAGVGPIDAETARRLAGGAKGWDRVLTHPITGHVVAADRYRPGKQLKRILRARDQHCRFPGCRLPVRNSDLDHTVDFALGGPTTYGNLAHLCRRHHSLKHESAWAVKQRPSGVLEWTSPTGRRHPDVPTSSVMFRPGGGPGAGPGTGTGAHRRGDALPAPRAGTDTGTGTGTGTGVLGGFDSAPF